MVQLYYWLTVDFPKPWKNLKAAHSCMPCTALPKNLNGNPGSGTHIDLLELNHIWNWSCVAVFGWIWTAKKNLQYWHKIYYPGHRPFTTNASYFNLIKCWQVYLARHRLRKWSNGRVGVSTDVWKVWGRRLFNHKHYNVQCC